MRASCIPLAVTAALIVGACGGGSDAPTPTVEIRESPSPEPPKGEVASGVKYIVEGDQARAKVPNEATADAACEAAQEGDVPDLEGVVQISYEFGGNKFGLTCMVPE